MTTAAGLAEALTSAFVSLVQPGADRPVRRLELIEPGDGVAPDTGDLVLALGLRDLDEVVALVGRAHEASGLVLRHPWVDDPEVRRLCRDADLPLLAVAPDATWSAAVSLLRNALDKATSNRPYDESADHVYHDLFEIADTVGAILEAPVTIEDATSRVLAYSIGQAGVDEARMSTIVGRQVPREVRDHFRALGVFRHLATSDEPVFLAAGEQGVKARYVIPVRAGGEWLGSIWAVMEAPAPEVRARELSAAAEVVALYLLRMRAQSELHRQVQSDQVRTVLRGGLAARPDWLAPGPWRVAALAGPVSDTAAEARCQLWQALTHRRGWREPLLADVDGSVYALLRAEGTAVGSWSWFGDLVRAESPRNSLLRVVAGAPVATMAELAGARASADELMRLAPGVLDHPLATIETSWSAVVLARVVNCLTPLAPVSPVRELLAREQADGGELAQTAAAVIDHWGKPRRAAEALGIHPNTVRHRMARFAQECAVDLEDPQQRLAVRLEIAAAQARD